MARKSIVDYIKGEHAWYFVVEGKKYGPYKTLTRARQVYSRLKKWGAL